MEYIKNIDFWVCFWVDLVGLGEVWEFECIICFEMIMMYNWNCNVF